MKKVSFPFWQFSISTYSEPEVSRVCLDLQERWDVDVNVLLFLLWCASECRRVSASEVHQITEVTSLWSKNIVGSLRAARRFLKDPPPMVNSEAAESLRNKVKANELEAERLQQELMYSAFPLDNFEEFKERRAAAAANISAYGEYLGHRLPEQLVEILIRTKK